MQKISKIGAYLVLVVGLINSSLKLIPTPPAPQIDHDLLIINSNENKATDELLDPTALSRGGIATNTGPIITQSDIASGGTYIITQPGKYSLNQSISYANGTAITINTTGVTLDLNNFDISRSTVNLAPTTSGAIVDNGGGNLIMNGAIYADSIVLNSNNTTVQNCTLNGASSTFLPTISPASIVVGSSASQNTIEDCDVLNSSTTGILIFGSTTLVQNCETRGAASGGNGIYVGANAFNTEIRNCVSSSNSRAGIINDSPSIVVCNNSVTNNTTNLIGVPESSLCNLITTNGCDFIITQAEIGTGGTYTITQPGKYCLSQSITYTTGTAITINTTGVVINLNGFEMRRSTVNNAPTTSGAIVDNNGSNIIQNGAIYADSIVLLAARTTVQNCTLNGSPSASLGMFTPASIVVGSSAAVNTIENCDVLASSTTGMLIFGTFTLVQNCETRGCFFGANGIYVGVNAFDTEIRNCVSSGNSHAGIINDSPSIVVCNNSVTNNPINLIGVPESSLCNLIASAGCDFTITQAEIGTGNAYGINQSGKYCLSQSISYANGTAISINTTGVTLDLRGFEMTRSTVNASPTTTGAIVDNGGNNIIQNGSINGDSIVLLADRTTVQNCTLNGAPSALLLAFTPASIVVGPSGAVNTIEDCDVLASNTTGILIFGSNTLVQNCETRGSVFGANGIYVGASASDTEIRNCVSSGNSRAGIINDSASLVVCNNSVNYNTTNLIGVPESSLCNLIPAAGCDYTITQAEIGTGGIYGINLPGKYCLIQSISYANGTAISINTTGVTLDLQGFEMTRSTVNASPTTTGAIVDNGGSNIIKNGTIYADSIILQGGSTTVQECILNGNKTAGTQSFSYPAIVVNSPSNIIEDCDILTSNTTCLLIFGSNNLIQNCVATGAAFYGFLLSTTANDCIVRDCTASHNQGTGFYVNQVAGTVLQNCDAINNSTDGFHLDTNGTTSGILANNCTASFNGRYGFIVGELTPLVALQSGGTYAITNSYDINVVNCVATGNTGSATRGGNGAFTVVLNITGGAANTYRFMSPPVGILISSTGSLLNDTTAGSSNSNTPVAGYVGNYVF